MDYFYEPPQEDPKMWTYVFWVVGALLLLWSFSYMPSIAGIAAFILTLPVIPLVSKYIEDKSPLVMRWFLKAFIVIIVVVILYFAPARPVDIVGAAGADVDQEEVSLPSFENLTLPNNEPEQVLVIEENPWPDVDRIEVELLSKNWDRDIEHDGILANLLIFSEPPQNIKAKGTFIVTMYKAEGVDEQEKGFLVDRWDFYFEEDDFFVGECGRGDPCGVIAEIQLPFDETKKMQNYRRGYMETKFVVDGKSVRAEDKVIRLNVG